MGTATQLPYQLISNAPRNWVLCGWDRACPTKEQTGKKNTTIESGRILRQIHLDITPTQNGGWTTLNMAALHGGIPGDVCLDDIYSNINGFSYIW